MNPLSKSKISDIATSYAGGTPKRTVAGYYNGTIPWVKSGEINSVNIFSSEEKITDEGLRNSSAKLVEPGAILVAMYGATAGKVGRLHIEATTNQAVLSVRSKNSNVISNDYLFWLLTFASEELIKQCQGAAQPNLSKQLIDGYQILYPSITEQQKIAEILSTVDKKIDLIDQKITETEKLKTGLMQKLFSEGVGVQDENGNWQPHTDFQDSPFGKVPSSWALETLEQRLDVIKDGTHFSPKSKEGPCKYLTSKNIRFGELDLTNISYISQEEHDRIYKGSPVKYGDILLTKDGANTGNAAINTLEEPFSLLSSVAYLRGSEEDVDHGYLLQLLLSPKGQSMMKSAMAGQAITRLTLKKIGAFVLPFAPIDEQNEIERILSTVDKKLQLLKKQKSETQQLKKGLMQKLLTGEWRVPVEETEAA
ncbi:restriction endonuclease subunit S [Vibrio sp. Vb1337]|uniref:restriction endonuclease subunit S n=1 Tax=Vibrio sp. Vb1337 TaxID=3074641 RepID=UPI002963D166|nr:restriction endonuclease subunit S [Vibrio sp. Vb1337]MDW1900649.1 restriction endonuclease subunit S [Vibrio sp. Vb1337]